MAALADIRQRVYDYLYGSFPTEAPFVSQLAAAYTNVATSITVLDDDQWEINDILENTLTGEQAIVVAKPGTDVLTVIRGWAGTTKAASTGSDDPVLKNPRFSQAKVDKAITATLGELERWQIHGFSTGTITRADPQTFYELSETDIVDHIGVLKVYHVLSDSEIPNPIPFRYQYHIGTGPAEYSQGQGVHIGHFGNTADGGTLYFVYASRIDATTDLLGRQEELVVVGAAANLMGATISPATHDPGARTDRTTQPGQTSRDVRYFQGRFFTEARLEAAELSVERQKMIHEPAIYTRARRWVN